MCVAWAGRCLPLTRGVTTVWIELRTSLEVCSEKLRGCWEEGPWTANPLGQPCAFWGTHALLRPVCLQGLRARTTRPQPRTHGGLDEAGLCTGLCLKKPSAHWVVPGQPVGLPLRCTRGHREAPALIKLGTRNSTPRKSQVVCDVMKIRQNGFS